jgi:hypothetical protein
MRIIAAVLVATSAILTACGGGGDDTGPTTAQPPAPTTSTLSADDAFDQALEDQLNGIDAAFVEGNRTVGHTLCENLSKVPAEPTTEDPVLADVTQAMVISAVYEGFSQPAVAAVVLRATGEHLCPEHADAIEQVLAAKGQ